jgi:hypothetical protein
MLETGKELRRESRSNVSLVAGALVLILGTALAMYMWRESAERVEAEPVLSDAAKAYLSLLDLSEVQMAAREDALGQTLLTIEGYVTNLGEKTVTLAEINCVFRDINGVEIARERGRIVRDRGGPLGPAERKPFRLAFDNVPDEWNQIMPSLYVSQILFAEGG